MTQGHETRRELSAVPIAIVVVAIALAVFGGIWIGPWVAVIVTVGFGLIAIGALIVVFSRREHPSAADAPHVDPIDDGRYRILVIADQSCATPTFADRLRSHAGGRPVSVFVMAPALESRVGRLAGDQQGYDNAARHLGRTLEALEQAGLPSEGEIGASDPLQAADDGLRQFPANEIVFVTHPEAQANWLEEGVVATAESRYQQPVKHFTEA